MKIVIDTKKYIGDSVKYFQNNIVKGYGGIQSVETEEVDSSIDSILIEVSKDNIEVKYKMKDGAVRDDNTTH